MGGHKKYRKSPKKHQIVSNDWSNWRFWRNLLIYFFAFSWIGYWIEMTIFWFIKLFTGNTPLHGILDNWLEPYWIYGYGVVVCILFLYPINMRIGRRYIFTNYLINTAAIAITEYISGWILIYQFGSNCCWDYSQIPFNLHGQICLQNTLLFGAVATVFTLWIYPWLNSIFLRRT